MDINEDKPMDEFSAQNETSGMENSGIATQKLKEYGKEAYKPLMSVIHKYQDEFTPYIETLARGLQGGADSLTKENSSEVEQYVSRFFRESANGLNDACEKLKSKDYAQFSGYISELIDKRPSIMFSASYVAGLFFGRLGKHVVELRNTDQSLH